MSLRDFLSPKEPLGPVRHEKIMKFLNADRDRENRTNLLIYRVPTFDRILPKPNPILLGRRGAGKTAVITALLAQARYKHYYYSRDDEPSESKDIVTYIQSWDQLDEIINNVGRDCRYEIGKDTPWEEIVAETSARHWEKHIFGAIFNQVYNDSLADNGHFDMRQETPTIFDIIEKSDFLDPFVDVTNENVAIKHKLAKEQLISHLRKKSRKCFLIIDSLDNYPIVSPRFSKLTAGFLRCITNLDDSYGDILNVHCCMPEEIEPRLFDLVDNELRDLSPSSSYTRIHWQPRDLFKIVAERYKAFLLLNFPEQNSDDVEFIKFLSYLDFSRSSDVRSFFDEVLPEKVCNKQGVWESTLAYITRHTQLLPREFMLIFNEAIKKTYSSQYTWRKISQECLVEAISETESAMTRQILKPYMPIYRELIKSCQVHLSGLKPICSEGDLDQVANKFRKSVAHETENIWKTLFEIGVIGYIDNDDKSSDIYEYGRFHFNCDNHSFSKASHIRYCVHPAFSGAWNMDRKEGMKHIYPATISETSLV